MYSNIGGKIKVLAKVIGWIGLIAGILMCIILLSDTYKYGWSGRNELNTDNDWQGWISLVAGILALISSWPLYGFGELIEIALRIEVNSRNGGASINRKDANWDQIRKEQPAADSNVPAWKRVVETMQQAVEYKTQCANCGKELSKDDRFCTKCGARADN